MFIFESLTVYQKSLSFINQIYSLTKNWPKTELFSLTDQIRRASTSIALNIAEGSSRSRKDFSHFLDISKGSCFETTAILHIALSQSYITETQYRSCYQQLEELVKIIQGLKKSLSFSKS